MCLDRNSQTGPFDRNGYWASVGDRRPMAGLVTHTVFNNCGKV
jgi:hypothetical protein